MNAREDRGGGGADLLGTYLEGLRARIGARGFEAVIRAADATCVLLADGHPAVLAGPDGEADGFGSDLQREYLALLAVLITGRSDHRLVRLPCVDGLPGWAVVEDHVADDGAALDALCRQITVRARAAAQSALALESLWDAPGY
ncbi:hypothetical protein [Streptomyces sp. A1136]|uniref:hypothetical protein n=1 Tax=Streptomyces sp. A1136 TaxID=2563102 RepID=UPI00109E55FE|nr:hypothetical protein [Streptomyces sp. A1136]THA47093.1 hypothetical protein E6R62_32030 [Streptomyces sp. A1136]